MRICLSALAAVLTLGFATSEATAAGFVTAPKAGATATTSPVQVTVRAPYGISSLRVTLNGRDVTSQLSDPDRRGRRTMRVSASHGLQYGRNVVRVVRRDERAGRTRRAARAFTLTRARPLVGAGVDRTLAVGTATRLNGRASRSRRAPRPARAAQSASQAGTPAGLGMTWRLIRKPQGSIATLEQPLTSLVQPADSLIQPSVNGGVQPARPLIRPDKPGTYVAALRVSDGVTSRTDTVTLTATAATPLVPIDTTAVVGRQGIAVGYHPTKQGNRPPQNPGEAFYAAGGALQAVVLDRSTLEFVGNYSQPASNAGVSAMASTITGLDDSKLVLMTAWPDPGWASVQTLAISPGQPLYTLTAPGGPAGIIGAQQPNLAVELLYDPLRTSGYASFVGVPTFGAGDAWERVTPAPTGGDLDNGLSGFLAPDNNDNYAYLSPSPLGFDLGPDGQSVSLQLGTSTYTAGLPAGQGGFTAVYLDAQTLQPSTSVPSGFATQSTYQTTNGDGSANIGEMQRMASDLQTAGRVYPELLIAIRSIGSKPLASIGYVPSGADTTYTNALNALATGFSSVGGFGQWVWGMATQQQAQNSYSLMGVSGRGEAAQSQGQGTGIGTAATPTPSSTRLQGLLIRDKRHHYTVRGAANSPMSPALAQTIVSEPVAWPYAGSAALSCIGYAQGLGQDPRIAYWQQTYSASRWGEIQGAIRSMSASVCPNVPAPEFTEVQAALVQEIGWLINVKSYVGALTTPFTKDGLSSYADLQTVTDDVINAVTPPPAAPTSISGWSIFADLLFIAEEFEVPWVGMAAAVIGYATDTLSLSQDGPTVDASEQVRAAADQVGQQLADQLQDAADNADTFVNAIVADYGRLSTVGQLGGCVAGPNCPAEWQFTQTQQNAASRMYEINARREIWGGVMAAAYPFVLAANTNTSAYNGTFEGPQTEISGIGCDFSPPFARQGNDRLNSLNRPTFMQYGVIQESNTWFLVFSQQNFKGASERNTFFPPSKLLGTPFGALDPGGDPNKGGLGIDQFQFMVQNWPQQAQQPKPSPPAMVQWKGC